MQLQTRRTKGQRAKKGCGTCVEYTQESIALINAAIAQNNSSSIEEAIAVVSAGTKPSQITRIINERKSLREYYVWYLKIIAGERNIKGRSRMNKEQLVEAILRDKFKPLNVELALQLN